MIAAVDDARCRFVRGLNGGRAAKLGAAYDKRVFEKTALLQILDDRRIRPVRIQRELLIAHDVVVGIPRIAFAVVGLYHPHALFGEPHCHQTSERGTARPIKIENGLAFFTNVEHRWSFRLHAECGLHRFDRCFELRVLVVKTRQMHFIEMAQKADVAALQLAVGVGIRDVRNHLGCLKHLILDVRVVNHTPLIHRRQEAGAKRRRS